MPRRDDYYNRAKQQGYRSRAAYKLKQLDELEDVLSPGDIVVDLGAAPGGWLQVAAEEVGSEGTVIGVDLQRIEPLDTGAQSEDARDIDARNADTRNVDARVETIRGDMTEEETRDRIRELVDEVDVVLSDMAPNMTGEYTLDHARSVYLARMAFETASELLATDGTFVVKVFEGPDLEELRRDIDRAFDYVRTTSPEASRQESSEVYLIAKGFLTAPVAAGDRLTVTIEDVGREGDGIASVDGYRVFVPGTEEGETVEIEIEDVKPRFAFAKKVASE